MNKRLLGLGLLVVALTTCSSPPQPESNMADLPEITLAEFQEIVQSSEKPLVVNVWASWCLPCRAEAPLLTAAHSQHGAQVAFIGLDYDDNQPGAKRFLTEFDLPFPHYFDQEGVVLAEYGGIGVPRTYFFAAGGELMSTHNGVIDAATLALQIDELLQP